MRKYSKLILLMLCVVLCAASAQAAIYYVKIPYDGGSDSNSGLSWSAAKATVQAAVNAASAGDEIWVKAADYRQQITLKDGVGLYGGFAGTETLREQRDWKTNETFLDMFHLSGTVVIVPSGASNTTVIDGFTICKGTSANGGGIYCNSGASPIIANNTVEYNTVYGIWTGSGGGIYCNGGSPIITNNTIASNSTECAMEKSYGGGIYCYGGSPVITNNIITGNSVKSTNTSFGGGIYCYGGSPTIANNIVAYNSLISTISTSKVGGGICASGVTVTIVNNTIVGNSAYYGGGISCGSGTVLANNIVAYNTSGTAGIQASSSITCRYNCAYGNTPADYGGMPDPTGTNGNISVDPGLVDPDNPDPTLRDFHILSTSPCIDVGCDTDVGQGWLDMDGQARKIGEHTVGSHADIGADEATRSVRVHNYNVWGFVPDPVSVNRHKPEVLDEALRLCALRDHVNYFEGVNWVNTTIPNWTTGLTHSSLKKLNPKIEFDGYYTLFCSPSWSTDWGLTKADWDSYADKRVVNPIPWHKLCDPWGTRQSVPLPLKPGTSEPYKFIEWQNLHPGEPYGPFLGEPVVNADDWWLRDAAGYICKEYDMTTGKSWYVDVGRPGFKEAYLQCTLDRCHSWDPFGGLDGITFDYLYPSIGWLTPINYELRGYRNDDEWFANAWMPFLRYILNGYEYLDGSWVKTTSGLRDHGYTVIGNCAGEFDPNTDYDVLAAATPAGTTGWTWGIQQQWQRTQLDGTIYEQGVLDWVGTWLSGDNLEARIASVAADPLITLVGDAPVRSPMIENGVLLGYSEYDRRQKVSLAYYYIARPVDQSRHMYHHKGNANSFWQPLWDFYIGEPDPEDEDPHQSQEYFWERQYTKGLVLLNYNSSSVNYDLGASKYRKADGSIVTGNVELPEHTALILADLDEHSVTINQASSQSDPSNASALQFTAIFSEPVTGFDQSDVIVGGSAGGTKTVTVTDSGDHMTFSVAVTGMVATSSVGNTVKVSIPAGAAVAQADGHVMNAHRSVDNIITFEDTNPTVTLVSPTNGSTNIPVSSTVSVNFDELMDWESITTDTFKVKNNGTGSYIAGAISFDQVITSATFKPTNPLSYGSSYTAEIYTGVKDLAGNPLAYYSWSFTTVPE